MTEETDTNLLQRRGKFTIALPVVMQVPDLVAQLLRGLLITSCALSFSGQEFSYEACSQAFDVLEDGEPMPSYDVAYDEDTQVATWTRVV